MNAVATAAERKKRRRRRRRKRRRRRNITHTQERKLGSKGEGK